MTISSEQIISYLKGVGIRYEIRGNLTSHYTIASIFESIEKGFYFVTGEQLPTSIKSGLVLTNKNIDAPSEVTIIQITGEPQKIFYRLLHHYFRRISTGKIAATAVIHPAAKIGKNVQIDDFSIIGRCTIGEDTIIGSHVVLHDNTTIESQVIIENHSIIGTQGVAWTWNETETKRIVQPQLGGVQVKSNCFLGANTIIVRGSLNENTTIGKNCVLAPGSRLGHGTIIADYAHLANGVVTGGNTKIGAYSFIGSGACFRPHVCVDAYTIVGTGSVVVKNTTKEGMTLMGVPAKEFKTKSRPSGMPKPKTITH